VQLASDDVRDGAYALRAAIQCRRGARLGLILATVPGAATALLTAIGFAPPALVSTVTLASAFLAVFRLRTQA
jgi:hypothetical protein